MAVRKKCCGTEVLAARILVVPTGCLGSPRLPQRPSGARFCARLHGNELSDRRSMDINMIEFEDHCLRVMIFEGSVRTAGTRVP